MDNKDTLYKVIENEIKFSGLKFKRENASFWTAYFSTEAFVHVRVGVSATNSGLLLSAALPISVNTSMHKSALHHFVEGANRNNNLYTLLISEDGEIVCRTCLLLGADLTRLLLMELLNDLLCYVDTFGYQLICLAYSDEEIADEDIDLYVTTACARLNARPPSQYLSEACTHLVTRKTAQEHLKNFMNRFSRRCELDKTTEKQSEET